METPGGQNIYSFSHLLGFTNVTDILDLEKNNTLLNYNIHIYALC